MTVTIDRDGRDIPVEADPARAPGLLDGAMSLELTPQQCNLEYWLGAVAQGTLRGLVKGGHRAETPTPDWMRAPGPLRQALIEEFAFRSIAEEKATRALSYLVLNAPDVDTMEFFATQLVDEARHSAVFRGHLLDLGVSRDEPSGRSRGSRAGTGTASWCRSRTLPFRWAATTLTSSGESSC